MINFFSRTFIKRTQPGVRQSVQHEGALSPLSQCNPLQTT
jgi:hypothetical protein